MWFIRLVATPTVIHVGFCRFELANCFLASNFEVWPHNKLADEIDKLYRRPSAPKKTG